MLNILQLISDVLTKYASIVYHYSNQFSIVIDYQYNMLLCNLVEFCIIVCVINVVCTV